MNEQGFFSVYALWMSAVVMSLGLLMFSLVKWQRANAEVRFVQVRSLFLAHSAALFALQNNFSQEAFSSDFEGGRVVMERVRFEKDKEVTIRCLVKIGRHEQQAEVEWVKMGDSWKAVAWRDM